MKDKRYVPAFDLHYACDFCNREIKTNALKKPIQCPFCDKGKMTTKRDDS